MKVGDGVLGTDYNVEVEKNKDNSLDYKVKFNDDFLVKGNPINVSLKN